MSYKGIYTIVTENELEQFKRICVGRKSVLTTCYSVPDTILKADIFIEKGECIVAEIWCSGEYYDINMTNMKIIGHIDVEYWVNDYSVEVPINVFGDAIDEIEELGLRNFII